MDGTTPCLSEGISGIDLVSNLGMPKDTFAVMCHQGTDTPIKRIYNLGFFPHAVDFVAKNCTKIQIAIKGESQKEMDLALQMTRLINPYDIGSYLKGIKLDQKKMEELIESSFGKKLVEDYFIKEDISRVVLVGDYDGIAILEQPALKSCIGWEYLDKFAVGSEKQGNGLGFHLLSYTVDSAHINHKKNGIFWRCSKNNPSLLWYHKKIKNLASKFGSLETEGWVVFYAGESSAPLEDIVNFAKNKKKTIV